MVARPGLEYRGFAWAIDRDVSLALDIAATTADLQAAFGLARVSYDWAKRLVTVSHGEYRAAALVQDQAAF